MFYRFLALVLFLPIFSCNNENGGGSEENLPPSNGGTLDVLVVAKASVWQDAGGETLRQYLTEAQAGLPQPEPVFTVRQVTPAQFNTLLERSRNIIILEDGDEEFELRRNVWAKPQQVITISAPDEKSLSELIEKYQNKIISEIRHLEMEVIQQKLKPLSMPVHEVLQKHHLKMQIPESFELEREQENLLVLWNRTLKTDQGIIIYIKPLEKELTTLGSEIIPLRDSLTQMYIHGVPEGSYMKVEDLVLPQIEPTELDETFAMETRGLWRVVNDFKGGPFINFTVYDEQHNQLIFLDGFVFSPQTTKRDFLLELEAILRTLEIED